MGELQELITSLGRERLSQYLLEERGRGFTDRVKGSLTELRDADEWFSGPVFENPLFALPVTFFSLVNKIEAPPYLYLLSAPVVASAVWLGLGTTVVALASPGHSILTAIAALILAAWLGLGLWTGLATVIRNLGAETLRTPQTWGLILMITLAGYFAFRMAIRK